MIKISFNSCKDLVEWNHKNYKKLYNSVITHLISFLGNGNINKKKLSNIINITMIFWGDLLSGVSGPITFIREVNGIMQDLIVPEEFVKDFYFSSEEHLMIMIRVIGVDSEKVKRYFENAEKELFTIQTMENTDGKKISDEFLLISLYMDEGPPLSVDINQEQAMVRVLLDFKLKKWIKINCAFSIWENMEVGS